MAKLGGEPHPRASSFTLTTLVPAGTGLCVMYLFFLFLGIE